jgi:septum formation protein
MARRVDTFRPREWQRDNKKGCEMSFQEKFDRGDIIHFDKPTVVLASNSVRRARVLHDAGIEFVKIVSRFDDTAVNYDHPHHNVTKEQAEKYVRIMANEKLKFFIGKVKNGAVLTADSCVYCDGRILEKPLTAKKCRENHEFLMNKTNYAVVGYGCHYNDKTVSTVAVSPVKINNLPPHILDETCADAETLDAAGYRLSGIISNYVDIDPRDRANVHGLCPNVVKDLLREVGFGK